MPYKSKAQARMMHKKHPEIAKKWDAESAGVDLSKLPMHVKKKKAKKGK